MKAPKEGPDAVPSTAQANGRVWPQAHLTRPCTSVRCPGGCLSFPGSAALPLAPSCSLGGLRAVELMDIVLLVTGDCP